MTISQLPEIASLREHRSLVRIPPEEDIPLTPRVQRLMDTAPFRRLSRIRQLSQPLHRQYTRPATRADRAAERALPGPACDHQLRVS